MIPTIAHFHPLPHLPRLLQLTVKLALLALLTHEAVSAPRTERRDIQVTKLINTAADSRPVRLARYSKDGKVFLYYLQMNGDLYEVDLTTRSQAKVYSALDHHVANPQGFAIGPSGIFYLVGNEDVPTKRTRATIMKGVYSPTTKKRTWSVLARTVPYPKSNFYDHLFNAIIVAPSGNALYINSGSRTDHGEIQTAKGEFPNLRETGLTACILRLPAYASNLTLPNNRAELKAKGYLFAEGTRNTFDFAFTAKGDLLGAENGPDRDMPDELNWLRPGMHYGFPWRFGNENNPQQFANYDPAQDKLLDKRFGAVKYNLYRNDPTFPRKPARSLIDAIRNAGPHADSYRDPVDGAIKDASNQGKTISTFTAHRSPLGLVVQKGNYVLAAEFKNDAFMLSWTAGDWWGNHFAGPFRDQSQDLLHLDLTKVQDKYSLKATRLVGGFSNPIDAEMVGNTIYVLEYNGERAIWQVTLPTK